jgi:hypothetical protein
MKPLSVMSRRRGTAVPQKLLRGIFDHYKSNVLTAYQFLQQVWRSAESGLKESDDSPSPDMLDAIACFATSLLLAVKCNHQKLELLAEELRRSGNGVAPGEFSVVWDSTGALLPRVVSNTQGDVPDLPDHVVFLLKSDEHKAVWSTETFEKTFGISFESIKGKDATIVFPGQRGEAIVALEKNVLASKEPKLSYENFVRADGVTLYRVAIRFCIDDEHGTIGVVCWDLEKGIEELRGTPRPLKRRSS